MIEYNLPDRLEQHLGPTKQVRETITVPCPECLMPAQIVVTQQKMVVHMHCDPSEVLDHKPVGMVNSICTTPIDKMPNPFDNPAHYLGYRE